MSSKILCVGELLWDALPGGLFLGGAPFNVACHLKMLGEDVIMSSRVGDDALGMQALKMAEGKGIDINLIQRDSKHQTGIVDVTLDENGNPSYEIIEQVAWDYLEANEMLLREASDINMIVYGTLAQRNAESRKTIIKLRSLNKINVYDVNLRSPFINRAIIEKSLNDADIVKMNNHELKQMARWFDLPYDIGEGVEQLAEKFNCSTVCVTLGSKGSAMLHKEDYAEHEGYKVKVSDTVGAGDAFLAALLYGIIKGNNNSDILEFSNAVGAYVATQNGATPALEFDKIDEIINEKKYK